MTARMVSTEDERIGARMRRARHAKGMTQEDLAKAIGVKFQQVQKYETGINRISAARLFVAARALGVEISYFDTSSGGESILDDADALRAANIVERMPAHMKGSALRVLAAMAEGVSA